MHIFVSQYLMVREKLKLSSIEYGENIHEDYDYTLMVFAQPITNSRRLWMRKHTIYKIISSVSQS